MKTLKLFGFPAHGTKERVSGVDFTRIIQPVNALNGFEHNDYKFETYVYDPTKDEKMNWEDVAKEYDILYFNYTALPWEFARMGMFIRKYNRKMVMDLDDALWNIQKDNPAYKAYHKDSQGIRDFNCICAEVDHMTVTNLFLKNIVVHNTYKRHEKIKIFPNYVDLSIYSHRSPFKDDGKIQLLHFGSTTHFLDLANEEFEKGIDMIFKEYPNVTLKTVGAQLPKYNWKWGQRYENDYGHQDVLHWIQDPDKFPKFMDEADIMVVPLMENVYTKAKSNIKWSEASSAKKPGVWQRIRQYADCVKEGETGFLASTAQEWYESIKKLIEDKQLRKNMGEKSFQEVEKNWQIQSHREDYAEFFIDILTK